MDVKSYRSEMIGLFGCPVDENPTVVIMEAAFKKCGLNYRYNTTLVEPKDLKDAIHALKVFHMKGCNITIPHKIEVLKYLDEISDSAKLIGAVNTVYIEDGIIKGENTDGKGFIISLQEGNVPIKGKNAVILGAGGASRAIAVEMAMEGVKNITVVNMNAERGMGLVDLINSKTASKASFVQWNEKYKIPEDTDIFINGTSVGLYPDPNIPNVDYDTMKPHMVVCDVIPNPLHTKFIAEAEKRGCRAFDGFSMLVNQGAISFKIWTKLDAPVDVMKDALKNEFGNRV